MSDYFIIHNEDCLKTMREMADLSVDFSFTSPPYNRKRNDKYTFFEDINQDYFSFNVKVINELLRVSRNHVFYNIQANYYNRKDVYKLIGHFSKEIIDIHIWEKSNPMPASGNSITNAVEYFIVLGKKPLKSNRTYTKNILKTSVNSKMPKDHKAVMKPEVARYFIDTFTREGDTIFDCFMGYGTTGIESLKKGRKFKGVELSPHYYEKSKEALLELIENSKREEV